MDTYNTDAARAIRQYLEGHGITTNAPETRDLPAMPSESFRQWWAKRRPTS